MRCTGTRSPPLSAWSIARTSSLGRALTYCPLYGPVISRPYLLRRLQPRAPITASPSWARRCHSRAASIRVPAFAEGPRNHFISALPVPLEHMKRAFLCASLSAAVLRQDGGSHLRSEGEG